MKTHNTPTILIPVFDGDIGPAVFARARSMARATGARLVVLHIVRDDRDVNTLPIRVSPDAAPPRWYRLASFAPVFVDAVVGDPARVILSQAARFDSDAVVLGQPVVPNAANSWINHAVARVQRELADRALVVSEHPVGWSAEPGRSSQLLTNIPSAVEAVC